MIKLTRLWVACDLLGQAEHDPNSGIEIICMSEDFAEKVNKEVDKQLAVLPTRNVAEISWGEPMGGSISPRAKRKQSRLSDDYAPEHLEIHTEDLGLLL